jgi:uncharacterized protein
MSETRTLAKILIIDVVHGSVLAGEALGTRTFVIDLRGGLNSAIAEGQIFLGYPTLGALMQRVEYMNAIASIADDMTRKWIEFKASAGLDKSDRIKALTDKFEAIKLQSEVKNHIIHALGFGRAHLYLDTGDTDNKDELKTDLGFGARSASSALKMPGNELLGVRPIEPVWVSPHDYGTSNRSSRTGTSRTLGT